LSMQDSYKSPFGLDAKEEKGEGEIEQELNVPKWLNRINKARTKERAWRDRAKKCIRIYRDDKELEGVTTSKSDGSLSFNILWANVETLLPALFSAVPKPDIRNRYLTQDKVAETAGQVLERTLSYSLDLYNFARTMKAAIKDYLLTGRCVMRVRLIPEFEHKPSMTLGADGQPEMTTEKVLKGQAVRCELVNWEAFIIEPAKRFEDVNWIAFIHMLTEEEFEEYFPGAPLVAVSKDKDQYGLDTQYQVYEVWDKIEKKVYFIGQADKPLKILDDPLKLQHFWPIPEPLYSIQTNDSLVPIPEYTIYQAQAHELNAVSYRITDLISACKFIGVYDAGQVGMSDILSAKDSQLTAVTTNVLRQGGLKSVIDVLDTSSLSKVLSQLYQQRDQIKSIIYEVTGISDIIRGESKASETATAQNIKAQYAGLRLRDRRDNINRFIVDLLRIKAEIICTFFSTEQLSMMSGLQITPDVERLLRDDVLQSYKIDIESDSTILADMQQETQQRAQLVTSITQFIGMTAPLIMQGALPIETAKALLNYALSGTKITRELQDAIELIGTQSPPMQGPPGMPPAVMPPPQQGMPPQGPQQMHPDLRQQMMQNAMNGPTGQEMPGQPGQSLPGGRAPDYFQ